MSQFQGPGLQAILDSQLAAEEQALGANEDRFRAILEGLQRGGFLTRLLQQLGFEDQRNLIAGLLDSQPQAFNELRDLILNRLGAGGDSLVSGLESARSDLLGEFRKREEGLTDLLGRERSILTEGFAAREKDLLERLGESGERLVAGFNERRQRALDRLEGFGEQAKKDIRRTFGDQRARAQQSLAARGLANSTILPSIQSGIGREETGALNRLSESIRREALGVDLGTSGDLLAAIERLAERRLGAGERLSGQGLAAQERLGRLEADLRTQLSGQRLSSQERLDAALAGIRSSLLQNELGTIQGLGQQSIAGQQDLTSLLSSLIGQQTGEGARLLQQLMQQIFQFAERRQDLFPDRSGLLQLFSNLGGLQAGPPQIPGPGAFA